MSHNLQQCLQGRRSIAVALLFSAFISAVPLNGNVLMASQPSGRMETGSLPVTAGNLAPAPYELRLERVPKGRQRMVLAARLERNGGLIHLPIAWRVRHVDALSGKAGEIIFSQNAPRAELLVPAGEYEVDIVYGYRHVRQRLKVLRGQKVHAIFNLNVGGVRALPEVASLGLVRNVRARQRIFALSGAAQGRLVATWDEPGRILRLASGEYRIESRFLPGNAMTRTHVRVKPGILSTIRIAAQAGMARIETGGGGKCRWALSSIGNAWRHEGAGTQTVILAPGKYVLHARCETRRSDYRFEIRAGQRKIFYPGRAILAK